MSERIDIAPEVHALCEKFGVDHDSTLEITLRPGMAEVVVGRRNKHGSLYVDNGSLAKATFEYEVKT